MKFSCDRHAIADAFQLVAGVAPQRSLKPILTTAKVTVGKKAIRIEGTDYEVAVRCSVKPLSVEEEGAVVVPAEKMASILRDAADDRVQAETAGDVLTVVWGDGFHKVMGESVEDFPAMPKFGKAVAKLSGGTRSRHLANSATSSAGKIPSPLLMIWPSLM